MTPDDIGRKTFSMVRKGFDPIEVQGYLLAVATELREARSQALALDRELQAARQDAERSRDMDPSQLTALLGEETARVLDAARVAADEMRAKAEQSSSLLLSETIANTDALKAQAEESSTQLRAEAEAAAARCEPKPKRRPPGFGPRRPSCSSSAGPRRRPRWRPSRRGVPSWRPRPRRRRRPRSSGAARKAARWWPRRSGCASGC